MKNDYFYQKSKFYYDMHKQNKLVKKVCAFIKNDDKFLVLINNGKAQNIGGSVDFNEKTKDAVIREVLEEANATVCSCKYITKRYYKVDWKFEDILFDNKRVEYFYLCSLKDNNVKLRGLNGEFDDNVSLKWCKIDELEKLGLNKYEVEIIKNKIKK